MNLHWKREFFSKVYQIFSESSKIGVLKTTLWSTTKGRINSQEFQFKKEGLFNQTVKIIESSSNSVIGKINYNIWRMKASIKLNDESYTWKYKNLWNTKWNITSQNDSTKIDFHGSFSDGKIKSNGKFGPLILAGLLIENYYKETTTAVFIAILIPIFLT